MSHKAYIGVLAHHEPLTARPTSFIPADQADLLLDRLFAEPISRTKIRMLHPESVFMTYRADHYLLDRLPASLKLIKPGRKEDTCRISFGRAEIPGLFFQPPESDRIKRGLRAPIIREAWDAWKNQLLAEMKVHSL